MTRWTVALLGVLTTLGSAGCKPKDCEAAIAQSGDVQVALGELDLTKAKAGATAVAKAFAGSESREIANLAGDAERLAEAIGPMQDRDVPAEDRDGIKSHFDFVSANFLAARQDVRRVCE